MNRLQDHIVDALPLKDESAPVDLFRRPYELGGSQETEWIAPGLVARGNVTELTGKVKTSGKTTFALTLVRAVLDHTEFIGKSCETTPIVYLTEQSDSSFRAGLQRAGLLDYADIHVMSWHRARKLTWSETVAASADHALLVRAGLIIVDTLGRWTGASGDAENSAGAAGDAMEPLKLAAAEHNLAVLTLRHGRKSGGEVGDDGRGSSAFSGDADILLSLRRPEGNHASRPNIRALTGVGRLDGIPEQVMIELQGTDYVALGTNAAISAQAVRAALQRIMPTSRNDALTEPEIVKQAESNRSEVRRVIGQLVDTGNVVRVGAGKRGDSFRYYWSEIRSEINTDGSGSLSDREKLSDQTLKGNGMDTNSDDAGHAPTELIVIEPLDTGKRIEQKPNDALFVVPGAAGR